MLSGKWTYRSFKNDPALIGDDAAAALALIFGEGIFDFDPVGEDSFHGGLGMGTGYALTLTGTVLRPGGGAAEQYAIVGHGIAGTNTEGWRYDYRCVRGHSWPDGVDQLASLVGTVVRVAAHGPQSPAGFTASFIAVQQRDPPAGLHATRRNVLTAGL
jgi:hypothetical protein